MALVNRRVLVEYDVPGPRLWHERLALEHIRDDVYIVVTPDRDVYAEELGLLNSDIRSLRVKQAHNRLPAGVVAAEVYPLPRWGANEMEAIKDEARQVADQERGPGLAPRVGNLQPAVGQGTSGQTQTQTVIPLSQGFAAGELKWLAAECGGGTAFGQELQGVGDAKTRGAKTVFTTASGYKIFAECVDGFGLFDIYAKTCGLWYADSAHGLECNPAAGADFEGGRSRFGWTNSVVADCRAPYSKMVCQLFGHWKFGLRRASWKAQAVV